MSYCYDSEAADAATALVATCGVDLILALALAIGFAEQFNTMDVLFKVNMERFEQRSVTLTEVQWEMKN